VSPSWTKLFRSRKATTLVLSPAGIALSRAGAAPVSQPANFASLAQAIEAARAALSEAPNMHGGTRLNIILAGTWGRCLLTPPVATLPAADDLTALARQTAAEAYGPQALDWHTHIQAQGPGLPLIVSVIEPSWLDALQQLAASLHLQLESVTPLLAACWNQSCRRIPAQAAWFALAEPGRVQLLALQQGKWSGMASTRCEAETSGLRTLLHREAQLMNRPHEEGEAWVYTTHQTPPPSRHWRWNLLTAAPALPFANLLKPA
jgi:hypothetical protein